MTFEPKATRAEAYAAIDSERAYQEKRWGEGGDSIIHVGMSANDRTLDEFALYIRMYAEELAVIAAHESDPEKSLDFIRKVGALCIGAMEAHGAPCREGFEVTEKIAAPLSDELECLLTCIFTETGFDFGKNQSHQEGQLDALITLGLMSKWYRDVERGVVGTLTEEGKNYAARIVAGMDKVHGN